jgi:hypothetical protein
MGSTVESGMVESSAPAGSGVPFDLIEFSRAIRSTFAEADRGVNFLRESTSDGDEPRSRMGVVNIGETGALGWGVLAAGVALRELLRASKGLVYVKMGFGCSMGFDSWIWAGSSTGWASAAGF